MNNSQNIAARDVYLLFIKYYKVIFGIVFCLVSLSLILAISLPKKYTSYFEINVYSKYFQNPLTSGIVPEVYNIPEMRFTIESMAKEAIDDKFIDKIGVDYAIYSKDSTIKIRAKERQLLRNHFTLFSNGGQSYKVLFSYSDPFIAKEIAEKTLRKIKKNFIESRIKTIEMVKAVMVKKLTSFNSSQNNDSKANIDKVLLSRNPDILKVKLSKVKSDIQALKKQYKESHPKIKHLLELKKTLRVWLDKYKRTNVSENMTDLSLVMNSNKIVSDQILIKFYTKYHDFNIALEIEKKLLASYIGIIERPQFPVSAVWPSKRLFASLGLILGISLSFIFIFFKEVIIPNKNEKLDLFSKDVDSFVLGIMPEFKLHSDLSDIDKNSHFEMSNQNIQKEREVEIKERQSENDNDLC